MRGGVWNKSRKTQHHILVSSRPLYLSIHLPTCQPNDIISHLKLSPGSLCCSIDSFPQDLRGQPGLQEAGGDPSEAVQGLREDRLPAGQTSLLNILQVDRWINRSIDI